MYRTSLPLFANANDSLAYKPLPGPVWANTTVVVNALGRRESFSIGADGCVWSFEIATGTHKAGKPMPTGLQATSFTVGKAGNGRLVLVAVDVLAVHTSIESGLPASSVGRWSTPKQAALPIGKDALFLEKVFAKTHDGNLFVGVTAFHTGTPGRTHRQFWHGVWASEELVCGHQPMHHQWVHNFWWDIFCTDGHWRDVIS